MSISHADAETDASKAASSSSRDVTYSAYHNLSVEVTITVTLICSPTALARCRTDEYTASPRTLTDVQLSPSDVTWTSASVMSAGEAGGGSEGGADGTFDGGAAGGGDGGGGDGGESSGWMTGDSGNGGGGDGNGGDGDGGGAEGGGGG